MVDNKENNKNNSENKKNKPKLTLKSNNVSGLHGYIENKQDANVMKLKKLTSYESRYKPDVHPALLIWHLELNFSFDSFAATLLKRDNTLITTRQLYRWLDRYPQFRKAKDIGESLALKQLESLAKSFYTGIWHKDMVKLQTHDPDRNILAFVMKCRFKKTYDPNPSQLRLIPEHEVTVENKKESKQLDLSEISTEDLKLLLEIAKEEEQLENENKNKSSKQIEFKENKDNSTVNNT